MLERGVNRVSVVEIFGVSEIHLEIPFVITTIG